MCISSERILFRTDYFICSAKGNPRAYHLEGMLSLIHISFEPHYSKTLFLKIPVGIDNNLKLNRQIMLFDGDYKIDD